MQEKHPLAANRQQPKSLTEALNAHKKHEVLESEVAGHQTQIDDLLDKGDALLKSRHYAADKIGAKRDEVKDAWKTLYRLVDEKRVLLNFAKKVRRLHLNEENNRKVDE